MSSSDSLKAIEFSVDLSDLPKRRFIAEYDTILPDGLAETIYCDSIVEERFWYSDEKSATAYLHLKQSQKYKVFSNNFELLQKTIDQIAEDASKFFQPENMFSEFIALGIGSAEKETALLKRMLELSKVSNKGKTEMSQRFFYEPVDISFTLLQNSLSLLLSQKLPKYFWKNDKLKIRPVLTDLLKLNKLQLIDKGNKLITALGLLWNLPVDDIFATFKSLSTPNDLVLFDLEFIGKRNKEDLKSSYEGPEAADFFYHPIDLLTRVAKTKAKFKDTSRKPHRIKSYSYFKHYLRETGHIDVDVIDHDGIDGFVGKYNLSKTIKKHLRLSPLKKSETVVILFVPDKPQMPSVVLGYSTRFDFNEFITYVKNSGFRVIKSYLNSGEDDSTAGYFLLSPKLETLQNDCIFPKYDQPQVLST